MPTFLTEEERAEKDLDGLYARKLNISREALYPPVQWKRTEQYLKENESWFSNYYAGRYLLISTELVPMPGKNFDDALKQFTARYPTARTGRHFIGVQFPPKPRT